MLLSSKKRVPKLERKYQGERIGEPLARWLQTQPANSDSYRRIASLVELMREVTPLSGELHKRVRERFTLDWWGWKERYEDVRERVNGILSHYHGGAPQLTTIDEEVHGVFDLFRNGRTDQREWGALNAALHLASRDGLLHRVRQCAGCGQWFFARRDDQDSCTRKGNKCRIKKYRSTDKWKHHHREQERKRYQIKRDHSNVR
jgi:hypothetical protein